MKTFKKLKKGFTLVELVVVIAVIAILAAVSVGAYFGVTESANNSKLEQEAKQVHTAIQTVALAPNEHSSLTSNGLTITDVVAFKAAVVESLGRDVALTDEQDTKDDNLDTICFYVNGDVNPLLGDARYDFFEYHIAGIGGKKATVDVVTGETKVITTTAAGEDMPDPITSIEEALSAKKGLIAILNGTVVRITDEWDDTERCMSFIIEDETEKSIEVYKCNTNVIVGDIVTVTGTIGEYNNKNQIAKGSTAVVTGHDDSKDEIVYITSIIEALAANDNDWVKVVGTVVSIDTPYSEEFKNISITIADEQGNRILAYRVSGNAELYNNVEITGQLSTYKGNKQIAEGGTLVVKEGTHTCSNFTNADCYNAAKCIVCGQENGTKLEHIDEDTNGLCDNCEAEMSIITVTTILSEYAAANNWVVCSGSSGTPEKTMNMDNNITVTADGGTNTGKYYSNGWRIYATDSPAGKVTFTAKPGYEFKSITINALTGEYANLYLDGTTTNVTNQEVEVSGSSAVFNSVKNGDSGKQIVITSITVKYIPVEVSGEDPVEPTPAEKYTLTITTDPTDAVVVLTTSDQTVNSNVIEVETNTEVTYTVSKEGYISQTGSVVVVETKTIKITLKLEGSEPTPTNYEIDFGKNFSTYAENWSTSYGKKTLYSSELGFSDSSATVEMTNANKQNSGAAIDDLPVLASKSSAAQYVYLKVTELDISKVSFELRQWKTVKFKTLTIEYSTDGSTWKSTGVGFTNDLSGKQADSVSPLSFDELPDGVIAVRLVVLGGTTSNNQVGISKISYTK